MMTTAIPVQDELELETLAEVELNRLKRQYRIMENDRVTYVEDARNQMRNQQMLVSSLETDKAELVLAIKAAKSPFNVKKDEVTSKELKTLLDKRNRFMEQIREERIQIDEMHEQIIKISKEVDVLKAKVRTDNQIKESEKKNERFVYVLENRLEMASRRFNILVANNSKLRKEIDDLLKERERFNALWNKLNAQLNTGKSIINDLIEQATIMFNQRDDELNKINALKDRGIRDLKNHTMEMCELQRTMDNEMKLQEFLGVKGQYRQTGVIKSRKDHEKEAKRAELRNKIQVYNQILNLVKQFTGEKEIDKLTAQFVKQEEENFALFNYVNELNDELDGLESRVAQLRKDIDSAKELNIQRGEKQMATLSNITDDLRKQVSLSNKAEKTLDETTTILEKLLRGIENLFASIRCDNSPLLELLGDNTSVSMSNVMLYLQLIEKRISEMMNKLNWVDKVQKMEPRLDEDKKMKLQIPILSEVVPTQPCPLCVEKEEMQNVSEGLEIPLTLNEVKEKLSIRLKQDHTQILHNVSGCHLPASRKIIQKRYQ